MCWANIKELLCQERKTLALTASSEFPQESAFETQHSALLACYLKTKNSVDAAARMFSRTLQWPEMTSLEKSFVVARLDFAWEIASILDTSRDCGPFVICSAPEGRSSAELLEWLLVDIWPFGCGRFLQTQKWNAEQAIPSGGDREPGGVHADAPGIQCVA